MDNLSSVHNKLTQFVAQQESVGIGLQTFKQKFVFNQNSGPDAIYQDLYSPSPSSSQGIPIKQQKICIFMMSQIIFKAGQFLNLPISTTIVALNIAQFYFNKKSLSDFDLRDIAMGATFLACKCQETLRRSYQVTLVFDYIFKMFEGQKSIKIQLNSQQYTYIKEKVIKTENQILFQLGFQISKLFDIPHRYISGLISSFNKHKQCNLIVQYSWTLLNDIYRTKAPIHYPGQVIASAAIFMALQKLNIPLPQRPWWILMEANLQQIKNICALTNQMYEISNSNQVNMNIVSQIFQNLGKKSLGITNVFPVPYYRKIRIQSQGLLKKAIEFTIKKNQSQQYHQNIEVQIDEDKPLKSHKEKSKKEKKKNKKRHKQYNNHEKSKSESEQHHFVHKRGKYQNDDETPKIKNKYFQNVESLKISEISLEKISQCKVLTSKVAENFRIQEQTVQRKNSDISEVITNKDQTILKKSALFDAKSMLSKFSQQLKKIEVKNQILANTLKPQESFSTKLTQKQEDKVTDKKIQGEKNQQKVSSSEEEDELMAELIKIKKKNFQKKEGEI